MAHYWLAAKRKQPVLIWVLGCVVLLAAALIARPMTAHPTKKPAATVAAKPAQVQGVQTHLLFVGDVFWGRKVQTDAQQSGMGYSYITHGLTPADKAGYNAWIANFECPVTSRDIPYQEQLQHLVFNCQPEYLPTLAKYFDAATLANNHMANNGGMWGLTQTRQNLQAAGIQYFGTYDMSQTNDICEVLSLPATTTRTHQTVHLPVALCGYMYVSDVTPTDQQLDVMKQYAKVMSVIAFPHMGIEYHPTAEAAKVSAYHRMVDAGADMVVGAHPHVIENSESYKGRLIQYSMGNFLFDQQILGRATDLGLGVGLTMRIDDGAAASKYEKVADSCKAYKDNCLAVLGKEIAKRPTIHVSYNFTCFNIASGVPVKGSAADCAEADKDATLDRLHDLSSTW